ncbi:MAG: LytTR family DNA-binding domain-containing protein [bacterium]|nr:LytTR family DNA-binding domain-containing protein [bacterium]
MYRIILCDDDKRLSAQMEYFFKMNPIKVSFETVTEGEELLQRIDEGNEYDIYFIGNMLKKLNGIHIAKELRELGMTGEIVFISGVEGFFTDAFEVDAFRFMKKPLDWKKFRNCVQLLIEKLNVNNKYFYYKKENMISKIPFDSILYFESSRRVINIVTTNGTYSYYDRLDAVEEYIRHKNCFFIRIHKSYLVNSLHITQYEYSKLYLVNNEFLPISENKRMSTKQEYMNYIDGFVCGITSKAVR